ncbi:phosphatidylinositol-4- kinase, partial [Entomortierella beljakovae]
MSSIEFDLHSQILTSLASALAKDKSTSADEVHRLIRAGPVLPSPSQPSSPRPNSNGSTRSSDSSENILAEGGIMTMRHQHALIAQAKFAADSSGKYDEELVPRLSGYLHSLPSYRFGDVFGLRGKAPVDNLTFSLVTNLLTIASKRPTARQEVLEPVWSYLDKLSSLALSSDATKVCEFVLPSLNGLLAALETTSFAFEARDFAAFVSHASPFLASESTNKIREAIEAIKSDVSNPFARKVLVNYARESIILSSNRVVLQVLTVKRNMIARLVGSHIPQSKADEVEELSIQNGHSQERSEDEKPSIASSDDKVSAGSIESFDDIWIALMQAPAKVTSVSGQIDLTKTMRTEYIKSLQFFADMREFANELLEKGSVSHEFYYSEIMGTSLQLASLASLYIHELDDVLPSHVSQCLFNEVRADEFWIHSAALDCSAVLGINFGGANKDMVALLQQFLITPSPVFDGPDASPIKERGVERLAQTLKNYNNSDEVAMSTIYALLNILYSHNTKEKLPVHVQSVLIQENVISAISKIAAIYKSEKITPLVVSMLAQQVRHHSTRLDCVIVSRLADIALTGSQASFHDVTQTLSGLAKQSISSEKAISKELAEKVNSALLRLAKNISARPEFYHSYMVTLLKLFTEKGLQIQSHNHVGKRANNKFNSHASHLGAQLPILAQLLSHKDFEPDVAPTKDDVKLFRDFWFHCILFEFVKDAAWAREWNGAMQIIARKTPAFVSGDHGANHYLEGDLEYNSALPRGIQDDEKAAMRSTLTTYLPGQAVVIKTLSSAKVVFLLSVYHVETLRSRQGNCSHIVEYFTNTGVNDGGLSACLESIADQVINVFVSETQKVVLAHTLSNDARQQIRNLVIACAHRLKRVSTLATKWVHRMLSSFPQLMCDKNLLTLVLEVSELLWLSCENELTDEYCPTYIFKSTMANVTISLPDSYPYRQELLAKFVDLTRKWIAAAMANSPQEVDALLQEYLAESEKIHTGISRVHMGRTLAARSGKDLTKSHNFFDTLSNIPGAVLDNSSVFFQEFSARRRYQGEIGGIENFSTVSTQQSGSVLKSQLPGLRDNLKKMVQQVKNDEVVSNKDLANALHRAVSALVTLEKTEEELVKAIAWIPIYLFTPDS